MSRIPENARQQEVPMNCDRYFSDSARTRVRNPSSAIARSASQRRRAAGRESARMPSESDRDCERVSLADIIRACGA